jgi:hypothetical protein
MMRLAMVCCALGSVLALAGCSGSTSDASPGGTSQTNGGTGQTNGGTGQTNGGTGQTSGGSGPTGGGFTTSVPGSAVLGTLSDADASTLCMDLEKSADFKSLSDFTCRAAALFAGLTSPDMTDTGLQMACQASYAECSGAPTVGMCAPPVTCMATVAEYTACLNDEVAAANAVSAQLPMCSALKSATFVATVAALPKPASPASCVAVKAKCPDLAGDNGVM